MIACHMIACHMIACHMIDSHMVDSDMVDSLANRLEKAGTNFSLPNLAGLCQVRENLV